METEEKGHLAQREGWKQGSELGMRESSPILTLNPTPSPSRKFYAENLLFRGPLGRSGQKGAI